MLANQLARLRGSRGGRHRQHRANHEARPGLRTRCRLPQFSLTTILVGVTMAGVASALVRYQLERVDRSRRVDQVLKAIHRVNGEVHRNGDFGSVTGITFYGRMCGFDQPSVTDHDLRNLSALSRLEWLHLGNTQITDGVIVEVQRLRNLRRLDLNRTMVTDAGASELADMKELRILSLSGTHVTDASVAHLAGLTSLEILDLSNTQVTDAALAELGGLSTLKELIVTETRATPAGVLSFKKCLPNCVVTWMESDRAPLWSTPLSTRLMKGAR